MKAKRLRLHRACQLPLFGHPGGLVVDLFAGGGGASTGIEAAIGRPVDIAINHDPIALAVHARNHPRTRHITTDIWDVDPITATGGRRVWLLWASPDCTHHSIAKGGQPRRQDKRSLADVVPKWAAATRPAIIMIENVPEFVGWGPLDEDGKPIKERKGEDFNRWVAELRALGYQLEYRVLDASLFGAPTRRRRLFVIARCDGRPIVWPEPTHGPGRAALHTAAECIDWSTPCPSIFGRKRPLVPKTMWRIAQGLRRFVFENPTPFILKVNHGKWEPRHESIDDPMSTVTATQRGHAIVIPTMQQSGNGERKGQRARTLDLDKPLTTIMATGQKHALVAAWLQRYFGDPLRADKGGGVVTGADLREPLPTVTVRDHHAAVAVALAKFRGTSSGHPGCASVDEPLPTVSAGGGKGGGHIAEVRAFLTAYYGSDATSGQDVGKPLRTLTAKARLGLVTVSGVEYQISDIGLRMLQPPELLRAQFGRFASGYDMSDAETVAKKIWLVGNSVCPELSEALVLANGRDDMARAA